MKTAKELLQAYIDGSAQKPPLIRGERRLELPLSSRSGCGTEIRGTQRRSGPFFRSFTRRCIRDFKFVDVKIYIDTLDQAFGEYTIRQKSGISGKDVHQRFFGHCVAADGKIILLTRGP